MSADSDIKPCPKCANPFSKDTAKCGYCGTVSEDHAADNRSPLPDGVARHRGNRIAKLALMSMVLLLVGGCALGFSRYFWDGTIQGLLPFLVCGLPILAFGLFCGVTAALFAYRDLLGMKMGRVDRAGWWSTVFGGLMAVFSVMMYW